jgi:hypothetical protein
MSPPQSGGFAGPRAWLLSRLPSVAEIESEFRPPEASSRAGDINRFLEPERGLVSGDLFEPDWRRICDERAWTRHLAAVRPRLVKNLP